MAQNIVSVPLPADLPENWTDTQYVSPGGTEVGLTPQHGYNYLMKQVNNSQKAINELDAEVRLASAELGAPGWYRVARCSEQYASSFDVAIFTLWRNHYPTVGVLSVGSYWGGVSVSQQVMPVVGAVPKIRVVYNSGGGDYYVEIYYDSNTVNFAKVSIRNFNHILPDTVVEAIAFEPGAIPAGYTSVEYKLVYTSGSIVMDAEVG